MCAIHVSCVCMHAVQDEAAAAVAELDVMAAQAAVEVASTSLSRPAPVTGSGSEATEGPPYTDTDAAATAASVQQEGSLVEHQLRCISRVLFDQHRFKFEPFEWVYDGMDPMMLPRVVERKKGLPLMLAIIYCMVARRVMMNSSSSMQGTEGGQGGVSLEMVCATNAEKPGIQPGQYMGWVLICGA